MTVCSRSLLGFGCSRLTNRHLFVFGKTAGDIALTGNNQESSATTGNDPALWSCGTPTDDNFLTSASTQLGVLISAALWSLLLLVDPGGEFQGLLFRVSAEHRGATIGWEKTEIWVLFVYYLCFLSLIVGDFSTLSCTFKTKVSELV